MKACVSSTFLRHMFPINHGTYNLLSYAPVPPRKRKQEKSKGSNRAEVFADSLRMNTFRQEPTNIYILM
jgi:hypothetical protein